MDTTREKTRARKKIGPYILLDVIGEGEFGVVYSAVSTENNEKYAIKCQKKQFIQDNEMYRRLLNTEIGIMHKIQHPNIVHLHDLMESTNNYYLIIDFCNQGDFNHYLRSKGVRFLEERHAISCLAQIANGFRELRKYKIMHRDFKLANILVHDEVLKIGDFGLAKRGHEVAKTIVGTYMTMAPELLCSDGQNTYTGKADLWSVGFVYYQMLFGKPPFFGLSPNEIFMDIRSKQNRLDFPHEISPASKDLLNHLLQMTPDDRIDWTEFFNHPLFEFNFPRSLRDFVRLVEPEAVAINSIGNDDVNVITEFNQNRRALLEEKNNHKDNPRDNSRDLLTRIERTTSHTSTTPERLANLVKPTNITENIADDRDLIAIQRAQQCKEVAKRYYHEKNKILFIVNTVRNIRKLMKIVSLESVRNKLFFIAVFLFKKAMVLNELNHMSLVTANNIFDQAGFIDFMDSEYFNTVKNNFKNDKVNFTNYMDYLFNDPNWKNFPANDKKLINSINGENVSLSDIDEKVTNEYNETKVFEIQDSVELKHEFILMLVSIFYSVECETYFPYKIKDEKFEWIEFYEMHEQMNDNRLMDIVNLK